MNVLSDFILRVDDAISVSDVNFAAAKEEKVAKKPVRKSTAKKTEAKKPAAAKAKTVKTKKKE